MSSPSHQELLARLVAVEKRLDHTEAAPLAGQQAIPPSTTTTTKAPAPAGRRSSASSARRTATSTSTPPTAPEAPPASPLGDLKPFLIRLSRRW
jgi:hypothetical protein